MKKVVEKPVEVIICDFCEQETGSSQRCLICGRDACWCCAEEQMPFRISDIWRRKDVERNIIGYVCKDCSELRGRIKEILDKLVDSQYYPR